VTMNARCNKEEFKPAPSKMGFTTSDPHLALVGRARRGEVLPSPRPLKNGGCFALPSEGPRGAGTGDNVRRRLQKIIARREASLVAFDRLRGGGLTAAQAAKAVRVSEPTLWRWRKCLDPQTHKCGRHSLLQKLCVPDFILRKIQRLQLAGFGNASAWLAIRKDPACPPDLKRYLRQVRTSVAPSLLSLTRLERRRIEVVGGAKFTAVFE
jgi:hypothetical protein